MLIMPKTKQQLIDQLKREKDFAVVAVHNGPAAAVAKEIAKLGTRTVSVIVTDSK